MHKTHPINCIEMYKKVEWETGEMAGKREIEKY